ncbi:MAG: lactonase family protein [Sphingomonas sp.]|uniref:lactonase family protein n=1 Tax=Sphingomonas sp. TaxID=28214 RepID=UPI00356313EE
MADDRIERPIASAPRAATVIARRTLLGSAMLAATAIGASRLAAEGGLFSGEGRDMSDPASEYLAYIGCRTTRERNARGNGITVARIGREGAWSQVQALDGIANPAFLAFDHERRFLFTVHGDGTEVSSFAIDPKHGTLSFIGKQSCQGRNPVHLAVDPSNKFLVVANHLTVGDYVSNVAVLPIGADGRIGAVTELVPLKGPVGPHRVEQPFAKPHQICFAPAGGLIAVPDKGLDRVHSFRFDASGKLSQAAPPLVAREGAGPRHLAFHPRLPFAYVIDELDSTVIAARVDAVAGSLVPFQILSALPDDFTGNSRGSEIAISPDGAFVFASNRGSDTIVSFAVDAKSGRLGAGTWQGCGGKTPRFFAVAPGGGALFVANEESDTIVRLALDRHGKLAAPVQVMTTGSPTCMVFAPAPTSWKI